MKHLQMTPALYQYMLDISIHEHPVLKNLRLATEEMPLGHMQIAPEEGQFLQFLIRTIQAKKVLELGTFTGYSALSMALALPEEGQLITCDINTEWTQHTAQYWSEAGVNEKISLRLAPAKTTLQQLILEKQRFDFIFIDADKTNYNDYYEMSLKLIEPSGIIAIDNIFWEGDVINPLNHHAQTREIRALNQKLKHDQRVYTSLLPIADGLFLIQPKKEFMDEQRRV